MAVSEALHEGRAQLALDADRTPGQRMVALDAYRGFIMVLLVGSTCFDPIHMPDRPVYRFIGSQFQHRPWGGAVLYDLIMPAFLFMVGVSMSFSVGRRMEQGADRRQLLKHFARRAAVLVVLSWIVISVETDHLHLQMHNILTQVALTSMVCFFVMQMRFSLQVAAGVMLLLCHTALYLLFPGANGPFAPITNFGSTLDRLLMGHNYRMAPAVNISFIPETVNVLVGVWIGNLLRSARTLQHKFKGLALGAVVSFALGLSLSPVVPINKWLWTATYTLYTSGWAIVGLMAFLWLHRISGMRRALFFFVVVGMNSLVVYCIGEDMTWGLFHAVTTLTPWLSVTGELQPAVQACLTFAVIWSFAYWLYRRGIFLRA